MTGISLSSGRHLGNLGMQMRTTKSEERMLILFSLQDRSFFVVLRLLSAHSSYFAPNESKLLLAEGKPRVLAGVEDRN